MGSVRARTDSGLLFFDFRFKGERCREQTLLKDTPANRRRLERALAQIETAIEAGTFDYAAAFPNSLRAAAAALPAQAAAPNGAATAGAVAAPGQRLLPIATPGFKEFAAQWLAEHQVEWRRSHLKILGSTLNGHLIPHFGNKPVGSITKSDVLAFRATLVKRPGRQTTTLGNRRINGVLAPLRQILADAADRYGFPSPMAMIKPLKLRRSEIEPFSLDQVQRLLSAVRKDYVNYFTVRFFTGMRTGECHGLKWQYVDFDARLLRIRETLVMGDDEYTKTDASQRDIQMTQVVFDALRRQHEATSKLGAYVFCNAAGQPLDNKNFSTRVWYPLLRHLGFAARRPYQMRHTAATLWLASGEAPEWIARQLGHSTTEMLFRVYSRYVPDLTRRDGSAIERLLASRFASGGEASESDAADLVGVADRSARKVPPAATTGNAGSRSQAPSLSGRTSASDLPPVAR